MFMNASLCNWTPDVLTDRPHSVSTGHNTSRVLRLSIGIPQGCILSLLLFTLLMHNCAAQHSSNHVKFADSTTVVGLISNNNESAYKAEVKHMVEWCQDNNLTLNAEKFKEVVVDFRKNSVACSPLHINGSTVETVSSVKFLGVQMEDNLSKTLNTTTITKKAQQHLHFVQKLKKASFPPHILLSFYQGTIESALCCYITVWFGNCTIAEQKFLQWIMRTAERYRNAIHWKRKGVLCVRVCSDTVEQDCAACIYERIL
ncbi:uncharacterized protein LOC132887177 [Neoarius graeffei]|uniref:uncharacterized protein LOC132887177 n=1 Tax=Neoarius graeffei TaxID=443677 RepID=UPI00298CE31E|nr:uncharacterized protein LOC132887177 [Neoarius graeffei]